MFERRTNIFNFSNILMLFLHLIFHFWLNETVPIFIVSLHGATIFTFVVLTSLNIILTILYFLSTMNLKAIS